MIKGNKSLEKILDHIVEYNWRIFNLFLFEFKIYFVKFIDRGMMNRCDLKYFWTKISVFELGQ